MPRKVKAKLKEKKTDYKGLKNRSELVNAGMSSADGVVIWPTPFPALVTLTNSITRLAAAIIARGDENRHAPVPVMQELREASEENHDILSRLKDHVNNKSAGNAVALGKSGFELTDQPDQIHVTGAVQSLRRRIETNLNPTDVFIDFERPLATENIQSLGYNIFRADSNNFLVATFLKHVTKTNYKDTPPLGGADSKKFWYWIEPEVPRGTGTISPPLPVMVSAVL